MTSKNIYILDENGGEILVRIDMEIKTSQPPRRFGAAEDWEPGEPAEFKLLSWEILPTNWELSRAIEILSKNPTEEAKKLLGGIKGKIEMQIEREKDQWSEEDQGTETENN